MLSLILIFVGAAQTASPPIRLSGRIVGGAARGNVKTRAVMTESSDTLRTPNTLGPKWSASIRRIEVENESQLANQSGTASEDLKACPACGADMTEKRRIDFSLADVIGASFVLLVLFGLLVLFIKAIGWAALLIAIPVLILVAFLILSGGPKELGGYRFIGGIWDKAGVIGGILFLIWAVVRYFVRFEVVKQRSCICCGFQTGETREGTRSAQ